MDVTQNIISLSSNSLHSHKIGSFNNLSNETISVDTLVT